MMGKSHLVAGSCLCLQTVLLSEWLYHSNTVLIDTDWFCISSKAVISPVRSLFFPFHHISVFACIYLLLCFCVFLFGTLLPDIDSETSLLGRYFHLPVEHHTITHTIWCVALLALCTLVIPIMPWCAFGYFVHLLLDAPSCEGVCFCYPISHYRRYPNHAKVKEHHVVKLYRTGGVSEGIFLGFILLITVVAVILFIRFWSM